MGNPNRYRGIVPAFRVYVYDFDSGEELFSGAWLGCGAMAVRNGVRYRDTKTLVRGLDLQTMTEVELTAARFEGRRAIVKVWNPPSYGAKHGTAEWFALVHPGRMGWAALQNDDPMVYDCIGTESAFRRRHGRKAA